MTICDTPKNDTTHSFTLFYKKSLEKISDFKSTQKNVDSEKNNEKMQSI